MKITKSIAAFILSPPLLTAVAQTETPKGFSKGSVTLSDGSVVNRPYKRKNPQQRFCNSDDGNRRKEKNLRW